MKERNEEDYRDASGVDYGAVIKALRNEVEKLDRAIAQLESLNSPDRAGGALLEALKVPARRRHRQPTAVLKSTIK